MKTFILLWGLIFATGPVLAQLAVWEVNGITASTSNPLNAANIDENLSSATLGLGDGVTPSGTASTFGGSSFNTTSLASAIDTNDYISFTLTSKTGYSINISSISFNSGVGTAVTNFNGALMSSATGFSVNNTLHTYSFSTAGAPNQSITLSSITNLQNISGTIEFRLYGWRDTSGTSTFGIRNLSGNDLVINGTTSLAPVPEPSTYTAILGGVALVSVVAVRRRKRAKVA